MNEPSKTQIKKALKRARIAEKYKERKLKNKRPDALSIPERTPSHGIRQERNSMIRADFESKCERGPLIIIDCDWKDNYSMTDKELLSLTQQVMYSYACNKSALKPVRLWIVGASEAQKNLIRNLPGSESWYMAVTSFTLDRLVDLCPCPVYLSADSRKILDISSVTQSSTLVIGGIVDRNRHKNATLNKAEGLEIDTAQLPIGHYLPLKSSKVLTVNHVVQLLLEGIGHHDWERALNSVIPNRKRELDDTRID
jgi:tRNA (guanine9-N1)-methyltransferase